MFSGLPQLRTLASATGMSQLGQEPTKLGLLSV
jgi:hypothetical protein